MATKSISQLTEVTSDLGTDKLEIAKVDALSASGYTSGSTTVDKLGAYINGIKTFSTLPTTDKTIVGSLSECFQSVSDGKTLIATAITDKGVQTAATDSFSTMATNISNISGGGGITPTGTINISTNGVYDVTQYASADVSTPVPTGTINITTGGTHDVTNYATADVTMPPTPTGTISILNNGTYDVTNYASANVSVSGGSGYPSRTLTFTSDTAYQITINIDAYFFKNASRILLVSVNGGTAVTLTSTIPLSISGEESFTIQDNCIVGSNTIEVAVLNSDIYISKIETYDEYDLPAFVDTYLDQTGNTSYNSATKTSTTIIGDDTYLTSCSSIFNNQSNNLLPNRPFDKRGNNINNDCWMSANGDNTPWLKLELPIGKYITKFVMKNSNASGATQCPKDVIFQGSNDNGVTWDNLESFVFSEISGYNLSKTIVPFNIGLYKCYRWFCQTVNSGVAKISTLDCTMANIYFKETW